ncbi:MAG TPA: S9 family peptidase [Xanthomonadales bacterium]|nr:S9 family peptidase [Xanthomonadales bacterium]
MSFAVPALAQTGTTTSNPQRLTAQHLLQLAEVTDPQFSPEGEWIAYTITSDDAEKDESRSRIWMVPAKGGDAVPLTSESESSTHPRWSPDGKSLAFLSGRDDQPAQVYVLNRNGGEAIPLTETPQAVQAFEWSPDSGKLALVLQDASEAELEAAKSDSEDEEQAPPPWVIDRQQFKEDYIGYLERRRTHIYVFDIASKQLQQLTTGDFDDTEPAWSPSGDRIAFTSNRTADADTNYNTDIWVISSAPGETPNPPLQVTLNTGEDAGPAWSPNGKSIAHTAKFDVAASLYATQHLAVSAADGSGTEVLTTDLDRMVYQPQFAPDGRHIWFLLEDSGEQALASIPGGGGRIQRMLQGQDVSWGFEFGPKGQAAVLISRPHLPSEVFLLDGKKLTQLSYSNRWLDDLQLGEVINSIYTSKDGTQIQGFIVKPAGFVAGQTYPVILDIHGGPQMQYDWSFHFEAQLYAAQGWLVVHPNPRGSTGRGQEFCLAIWQDWGGPDFEDVMAGVDDAIKRGWGDPERLGVVGWSYGGMLTNHVITKTNRFDAAVTGASAALYVTNFGHDQYQRWWEDELGLPWQPEARELWERISPFNQVDRVTTPTLVIGGERDWNVPIINSEQLYLALKRLGVDTQLVVYPGEYHGIARPSYKQDLYQRYVGWLGKYLNGED